MKIRKRLLYRLLIIMQMYSGFCCLVLSFWMSSRLLEDAGFSIFYDPDYSSVLLNLLQMLGLLLILSGVVIAAYRHLSIKIDSLSTSISTFNVIGIEEIIPLRDLKIQEIFKGNKRIKIIINVDKNHSFQRLFYELGSTEKVRKIQIILLGDSIYANKSVLKYLYNVRADSIEVKTIKKSGIENIIILDERTYVLNLSAIDNNLDYVISINNYGEHGVKSEKLFEDLWNEGDAVPFR